LSRPSSQSGSYTGLIGFNTHRLKGPKGGMSSHTTNLSVYAKSYSSSSCAYGELNIFLLRWIQLLERQLHHFQHQYHYLVLVSSINDMLGIVITDDIVWALLISGYKTCITQNESLFWLTYEERKTKKLGITTLERLREDLIEVFKIFKGFELLMSLSIRTSLLDHLQD